MARVDRQRRVDRQPLANLANDMRSYAGSRLQQLRDAGRYDEADALENDMVNMLDHLRRGEREIQAAEAQGNEQQAHANLARSILRGIGNAVPLIGDIEDAITGIHNTYKALKEGDLSVLKPDVPLINDCIDTFNSIRQGINTVRELMNKDKVQPRDLRQQSPGTVVTDRLEGQAGLDESVGEYRDREMAEAGAEQAEGINRGPGADANNSDNAIAHSIAENSNGRLQAEDVQQAMHNSMPQHPIAHVLTAAAEHGTEATHDEGAEHANRDVARLIRH